MSQSVLKIDGEAVNGAFHDALYNDEEIAEGKIPVGAVLVDGIVARYGFHPQRLEQHRAEVAKWLSALPHKFRESEGGGWSFLEACYDEDGEQWTGLHQRMEQLFCLGIGLGLATCLMPREMWDILPGGMPYYVVVS